MAGRIRGSVISLLPCALGLLLACSAAQPQGPAGQGIPPGFGAVQGQVVSELGKPLSGVSVYTQPVDTKNLPTGKLHLVVTNENGDFVLGRVEPGVHLICAFKLEAFYPDTGAAAFAENLGALPRVQVEDGKLTRGVTVRLSKGGKLTGTIVDSRNGQPLKDSRIRLSRRDDPRLFVSTNPNEQARFEFVVPSKPFKVEVSAPGYKTWNSDRHGEAILVQAESTKDITIRLQKINGATSN